ncbi:MAG: hypothetical protein ACP5NS_02290 [Candidatus Pacearchaeota archaeon]
MKEQEIIQIIIAIVVLGIVTGARELVALDLEAVVKVIGFSAIVIGASIIGKKIIASRLDSDVEHEVWRMERYGFAVSSHVERGIPVGVIFPLFITVISLGTVNLMSILTYQTKALKRRAAKRFGPFSFTEMTDYHNAWVGAAGIIAVLFIAFVSYWIPGASTLGRLATFYAFWNMIPFSKLDGTQIYFGSRVLWSILAVITLISTMYALLLV